LKTALFFLENKKRENTLEQKIISFTKNHFSNKLSNETVRATQQKIEWRKIKSTKLRQAVGFLNKLLFASVGKRHKKMLQLLRFRKD